MELKEKSVVDVEGVVVEVEEVEVVEEPEVSNSSKIRNASLIDIVPN